MLNDKPLTDEEIDHIEALYKTSAQFNTMARRLIVTIVSLRARADHWKNVSDQYMERS